MHSVRSRGRRHRKRRLVRELGGSRQGNRRPWWFSPDDRDWLCSPDRSRRCVSLHMLVTAAEFLLGPKKSKIAFRARAPGRRNPHSSSSPGKPDTWQRGAGDPMAGTWRDAKCKLPRRSSPSTENVADTEGARPSSSASDATSRSTPDDRRGHTRIRRNQSKDRATGEPDERKSQVRFLGGCDTKLRMYLL